MNIQYDFISQGAVVQPEPGKVFIDVGNSLEPGIIDHHQPGAPPLCAAGLVLRYPDFARQQVDIAGQQLTIIVHHQPDLDAVSGAFFARRIASDQPLSSSCSQWADYVCDVDQGRTRLDPAKPKTLYSLFMMRQHWVRQACQDRNQLDLQLLQHGFSFVETVLEYLDQGANCGETGWLATVDAFARERQMVREDVIRYQNDLNRAEIITATLPRKDGNGREQVAGLWLDRPESVLFKAWARGDTRADSADGFVFTGIQLSPTRHILSVDPDSPVYLKGLGNLLEEKETEKRRRIGRERQGRNRPGYDSPDPWYDGRSPLHNFTIVDAPREGTVLEPEEVRTVFKLFEHNLQ